MRVATPTEPGARPTSLLGGSDSFLQLFPEAVALPVTPRILQHRRSGGFGGLSFSVAAVSTIAAVATAYLLLRCAFYLADARRSRAAQRLLAGAKRKKNKEPGEPCSVPVEDSAPAAPAASGDGEEALVERDLLRRARLYAVGLRRLVSSSECLLRKLNADLRAKCVALFSSLSLVEFSSLLSLLERRDRAGMHEDVSEITSRLWAIRESIGRRVISLPRHRHIKCLHLLLRTLTEVPPVTMAIAEKQRLLRIHQLLQLQEMALGQLNVGLVWLRTSLESTKTRGNAKAPAGGAETGAALAAADARIAEAVEAMGVTVRKRREQVLVDPLLSSWLRSTHGRNLHYGLISRSRLQEITIRPLQTHRELLEDLQASPLGSGNEPWGHIRVEDSDAPQAAVSAPGSPCRGDQVPPPEGPAGAPLPQRRLKHGSQGSRKKVGSTPATAVSSLPSTSTSAVVGANTAEKNHAAFQGSSRPTPVALLDASNIFSHVSPPASASGPQVASLPAAPQQASVPSARNRPLEATWEHQGPVLGVLCYPTSGPIQLLALLLPVSGPQKPRCRRPEGHTEALFKGQRNLRRRLRAHLPLSVFPPPP
ncbi:hypothetical protein, conserved [Eimeria acervulina]|uniref:Uncharacterized protein n=1 Tax=Eimeria acervulina TaxID=5801 RepID=U6GNS2_EIMAC|nr:hypothetical protein, conserved [Eimeria acervulina]CDI81217.1 hypothetical protein, conserved [Eimeria acervulina]